MPTLVLTRHGLTARSDPEQHLGQAIDIGLDEAGRAQATALRDRLAAVRFDRVVTSPLLRATETAAIVAPTQVATTDARLAEMDYGAWEGLTYAEVEARDPEYRPRWEATPDLLACPDGESGNDVADRVRSFLVDLLAADADADLVLAIGHSTTNRILCCVALGLPVRDYRRRLVQGQANLTVIRFDPADGPGQGRLLLLNDRAHLAAGTGIPWR